MLIRTILFGSVAVGALLVAPAPAAAQDCGTACSDCGGDGYEGVFHDDKGGYNMACFDDVPFCVACPKVESVSDHSADVESILRIVRSVPAAQLEDALADYRDRILFSPERNLVVVKGNGCDPEALSSVLFVDPARTRALREFGFRSLDDYLDDK